MLPFEQVFGYPYAVKPERFHFPPEARYPQSLWSQARSVGGSPYLLGQTKRTALMAGRSIERKVRGY